VCVCLYVCVCVCVSVCVYMCGCVCICVYMYIQSFLLDPRQCSTMGLSGVERSTVARSANGVECSLNCPLEPKTVLLTTTTVTHCTAQLVYLSRKTTLLATAPALLNYCTAHCTTHCTAHCTTHCTVHCTVHCTAHCTAHSTAYCTVQ
jgi:hypothetical protein